MAFRISHRTKQKLARRWFYNGLVRLLIFKFWFRMAFLTFVLLLVFLGLFLPKIWRVSPPGTLPVIRISGLDFVQTWSLKRKAQRDATVGQFEQAHDAWLAAINNNPADIDALRGLIQNLVEHSGADPEALQVGLRQSAWLMHMTGTNRIDVELVSRFYGSRQWHDVLLSTLTPIAENLGPQAREEFLKSLFAKGRMAEFKARWDEFRADQNASPELALHWAAFQSGWSSGADAEAGSQALRLAMSAPTTQVHAIQLQLAACANRQDLSCYQEFLNRLQELRRDRIPDHTLFWLLLDRAGQGDQARELARSFNEEPQTASDLISLGSAYSVLGLGKTGLKLFDSNWARFSHSEQVWFSYASLLALDEDWAELQRFALRFRTEGPSRQGCLAYSYFLEGWSEHQLKRLPRANDAFQKMSELWTGDGRLALPASKTLLEIGYPEVANEVLGKVENEFITDTQYWAMRFAAADGIKNPGLLLKAAQHEYDLAPDNMPSVNHYAAALLVNRQRIDLAATLSKKLLATYPNSVAVRINHAFALTLNHRPDEARQVLSSLNDHALMAEEATPYHLVWFALWFDDQQYNKAWEALDRINRKLLYPTDVAWLAECQKRMPPRTQANL